MHECALLLFPPFTCMVVEKISQEFRNLKPIFQEVISDITEKMGSGMTVFLSDKVSAMAQWDEVHVSY